MKTSLSVVIGRVKLTDGKYYVQFLMMGGTLDLFVNQSAGEMLRAREGQTLDIDIELRPVQTIMFQRSVTVLMPCGFIGLTAGGSAPLPSGSDVSIPVPSSSASNTRLHVKP